MIPILEETIAFALGTHHPAPVRWNDHLGDFIVFVVTDNTETKVAIRAKLIAIDTVIDENLVKPIPAGAVEGTIHESEHKVIGE